MQQSRELEARKVNAGKNFASLEPRNHEVSNKVINLDSPQPASPIHARLISLVQTNIAFMPTWQVTQPNTATTKMFNTFQPMGGHVEFLPRPFIANMSYMPANASNMFFATLRGKASANDYANKFFPP